ncbi:MAG: class I SAM-dependent methyltransferase [Endomicrobiales bacterium]|nr:class I SAM-dependent methyltransferase [Endomicrobiales bacterium]
MIRYSREYFLGDCEGFEQFVSSGGRALSPRLKKVFGLAGVSASTRVLDVGCGRGELSLHCALAGAEVTGVDSSSAAIEIAAETLKKWLVKNPGLKGRVEFLKKDVLDAGFKEESFDVVILSDIIEHLEPGDFKKLAELSCVWLKKGGKAVFHTSPNRIFVNAGLKIYNILGRLYGIRLPWDMKKLLPRGLREDYHVNEQTVFSLKKVFGKSGFGRCDVRLEKNPHYAYFFLKDDVFIRRLNFISMFLPFKHLFYADVCGTALKL